MAGGVGLMDVVGIYKDKLIIHVRVQDQLFKEVLPIHKHTVPRYQSARAAFEMTI